MNISRQVVKFALRLLTLKIELTCMHFEISSTAFELGKYSIQQEDSTGKFNLRKNDRQNSPQFGTHSHTAELRGAGHRLSDYKFKTPFSHRNVRSSFQQVTKMLAFVIDSKRFNN